MSPDAGPAPDPSPPTRDRSTVDVVVVGAGLAGLVAARALVRAGRTVLVLEARDRVGGRTLNVEVAPGVEAEIGGQWVGPGQDRVLALLDELGLETFPTHAAGRHLLEHDGRLIPYRGDVPRVGPAGLVDLQIALWRLAWMGRSVSPERPWAARRAAAWDAMTVASWIDRHVRTRFARQMLAVMCEAVWAADPADLSLLHLLAYARSGGGLERLISTRDGAQQRRVVGGSQRIALTLAAELGDRVVTGVPARSIEVTDRTVTVHADGLAVDARRVIVAMSPTLAGRITYDPPLPARRDQLTQRVPQGSVIKAMAVYPRPFWRDRDLSGQVVSTAGPVKIVFDNSPPDGSPGILVGFFEGAQAREMGRRSAEERRAALLGCLTRFLGPEAASPVSVVERDWSAEPWSRGCYGAFLPPGTWTAFGDALRAPVGPIHWAGSETSPVGMGYMDGAVASGDAAARAVLAA
ncbi:MAG: flavin monoamine oxidase family protein [Solirubrobacteraceae bacterium]|nr:flavin monoamine oxidase family protein [Solirubrobacteraceae bacterium]